MCISLKRELRSIGIQLNGCLFLKVKFMAKLETGRLHNLMKLLETSEYEDYGLRKQLNAPHTMLGND
jgi:hypothetical protein